MNTEKMSKSELVYKLLKKSLNASSTRSKVIANNIANINTKGYKRKYVTFEDTLKNTLDNVDMKTTNSKHINSGNNFGEIDVKQDNSTSMREDGNNVDIDVEMANQAANTLMYNALVTQVNNKLSQTRYVITGGGR